MPYFERVSSHTTGLPIEQGCPDAAADMLPDIAAACCVSWDCSANRPNLLVRNAVVVVVVHDRVVEVGEECVSGATAWCVDEGRCFLGSAYYADFTSVDDDSHDDDMVGLADAYQAHNDSADPGSDIGEEAPDCYNDEENDPFSPLLFSMTSLFSRQLNWMQLLFLPTCGTMILIPK